MIKKRLFSILLCCCMMLTLLPTAVFAESGGAEATQCVCETACTAEQMNTECPVCGAADAAPEHCGKYVPTGGNADRENDNNDPVVGAISPEGKTGNSESPSEQDKEECEAVLILGDTVTNYQTVTDAMTAAQKDENRGCTVKLLKNVTLTQTLLVKKGTLTLDLAGFYLAGRFGESRATLRLEKKSTADLTIMDSRSETGTGYIENSTSWGDSSAVLAGGGKLTIESGRFLNGLQVDDKAQVKINGGIFVRIRPYNYEWGANAGGFTVKVTDGRQVHDLLREGCELYYAKEDRFVNCRVAKMQFEEELMLCEHPKHNSDGNGKCDCGYICLHKEFRDGVCTACGTAAFVKLTDSAGSETRYFITLAEAFNAVPGKSDTDTVYTVTPLGNRKLDFDWIQVNRKRVTLDLNEKTLSYCHIQLVNGAELTVTGNGTMNDHSVIMVNGACNLYVRNVTIDSVSVGNSTTGNNGTVYLQGGTIGLSIYDRGDAVLTGGTLTTLRQADATAMGMAESVRLRDILPKGYVLRYVSGKQEKLSRDTEIKNNDDLARKATYIAPCDHKGRNAIRNGLCIYCGEQNRIYYDLAGGSMDGSNPTCYSPGEEITLSNPVKNGYIFLGWSGGLIEGVTKECTVTVPNDYTGEIRFDANWEQKSGFTVRFDTGGGTPINDRTNLKWADLVLSDDVPQPEKAGYVFLGWICNNYPVDKDYTAYAFLAKYDSVMTVTLTAQWRQAEPPVLEGLTANAAYCESVTFTVSGEKSITEVKAGDTVLTTDANGRYTLRGELGTVTVTASDEDGQTTSVTVAVYGGHAFGAWHTNGNGTHSRTCSRDESHTEQEPCSGGTATCKEKAICEICGKSYGELAEHSYETAWSSNSTKHWHECSVCGGRKDEAAHSFGEWNEIKSATETEKGLKERICSACSYKETKDIPELGHTHTFGSEWKHDETNHWHECACGEKSGNAAHSGGKVDCHSKAICEICGESYGELDSDNHADLKHIEATAATKTAEGNIEYWYCSGCGKYYKDATATQEITKAQTVTAKLLKENDSDKSPQTGDNSNLTLWFALLLASGGAGIFTTVYGRKKKRRVK